MSKPHLRLRYDATVAGYPWRIEALRNCPARNPAATISHPQPSPAHCYAVARLMWWGTHYTLAGMPR